jgi:plastocyanin
VGTNPNSATLGGTKTVSAVAGVARFSDLTLSAGGNGYTLAASAPSLSNATSAPFNVFYLVHVGNGGATFSPAALQIHAGETVRWLWSSGGHTVTSGTVTGGVGNADDVFCAPSNTNCATAPVQAVGAVYDHSFAAGGTFHYFCAPHASIMTGTITVQ